MMIQSRVMRVIWAIGVIMIIIIIIILIIILLLIIIICVLHEKVLFQDADSEGTGSSQLNFTTLTPSNNPNTHTLNRSS